MLESLYQLMLGFSLYNNIVCIRTFILRYISIFSMLHMDFHDTHVFCMDSGVCQQK